MRKRGFTFVEILVALAVGVMAMAGVFMIYQRSNAGFRAQQLMSDMYDQLRFGLTHVRADLKKAGYLATPNTSQDNNACFSSTPLRGLALELADTGGGVDSAVHQTLNNRRIQPLNLILFGPYATTRTFWTGGVTGQDVYLMQVDTINTESNYPQTALEFQRLFLPGRVLRVVNADQYEMYFTIVSADFASGRVTLDQPVPVATANSACGYQGDGSGMEVSLLGFVRYRIGRDNRTGATVGKTDLIREEMRIVGNQLQRITGSDLHVAEYIVDLMLYDFVLDQGSPGNPDLRYFPTHSQGAVLLNGDGSGRLEWGSNAAPEELRLLTVKLSARTSQEDYDIPFQMRASEFAPLKSYDVNTAMSGAARVDSMASRVELTSFRARGL
jgi:prepilin-type N-terminal cleavage/methylation domain-containing protein